MFDVTELTVAEYHKLLLAKQTSCEEVVSSYLDRIKSIDPILRSVIHLNPSCKDTARELDLQLAKYTSSSLPSLFGVPIILKDTYATFDLPTTVGSKSLRGLKTNDAFVVTKLRDAGAVIIGKGNVHEFCLQGCTFSSLGGQTLNPYDLTRTPGGSSGGNAAAVAANLAMLGCGGDTMNSIRSPSSACNLVGLRPTMGQISTSGVVPVAWSQDAIGPIGRSVEDVRILFEVMRGENPDDKLQVNRRPDPTVAAGESEVLRIGLLRSYFPRRGQTDDGEIVQEVVNNAIEKLAGIASFVDVDEQDIGISLDIDTLLATVDVQEFEMKAAFDEYLTSSTIKETPHKTLASIAASKEYDERALTSVFHNTLKEGFDIHNPEYKDRLQMMGMLREALEQCLEKQDLAAIAFPHQRQLVMKVGARLQLNRNGILASLTGCPSLCIPGKQ